MSSEPPKNSPVGEPEHDEEGRSRILRLSHYQNGPNDSGWVRTTGHTADAGGGHDFLGKAMPLAPDVAAGQAVVDREHAAVEAHVTLGMSKLGR